MSARHRVALALSKADLTADFAHEVINSDRHATFVFKHGGSAEIVAQILRTIFKRKPLIHNGRRAR